MRPLCLAGLVVVWMAALAPAAAGPCTLEDIYGPSGNSFQAALGFRVFEGDSQIAPHAGYGVAVDDMRFVWREYKLVEDATDCATSGSCATIVTDTGRLYGGSGVLTVRILDSSPYGATPPFDRNDCDEDGSYAGVNDDTDCDNDGTTDVLVRVSSVAEPAGETFVADQTNPGVYEVHVPLSSAINAAGILRVSDGGVGQPEITIRYEDRWDGGAAGLRCGNSPNPAQQGFLAQTAEVVLVTGDLTVVSYRVVEVEGDGDGYPDTNETFDLYLTVKSRVTEPLTNVVVHVAATDPKIDCVLSAIAVIPVLDPKGEPGAMRETPTPIRIHVSPSADRGGVAPPAACTGGVCTNGAGSCIIAADCQRSLFDSYAAHLDVGLAADQLDAAVQPQALDVEMDLNSGGPAIATSTFVEGFETGLGNFALQNLDANVASNSASDGARCQYTDPDYVNSDTYGQSECYLGFAAGQPSLNDWHSHTTTSPDGGRAYLGSRSIHFGRHLAGGVDTTGLSQMDAVQSQNAHNLAARVCRSDPSPNPRACNTTADCASVGGGPCASASPTLSFKQQAYLYARHYESTYDRQLFDRGVVAAKIVPGASRWEKVYPYENIYDDQAENEFFSVCLFDPTDDGNTEDDYFDPSDPYRRLGPSSTCFPEFVFSQMGSTDQAFNPARIGRASDGPGLQGNLGPGTWVESKFDLSRYRGRAIRVRFLATTVKISDLTDYQSLYHFNPLPIDDGWYIDDVRITQTLGASTTTVSADTLLNSGLPACGATCSTVSAALTLSPPSAAIPGSLTTLSALGSSADRCLDGALLYRFFEDVDGSSTFTPGDLELAPFGVSPQQVVRPERTTRYGVSVRCSAGGSGTCTGADAAATFTLVCSPPPPVFDPALWWARGLSWQTRTRLRVPPFGQVVDLVRGDLAALRASGTFAGSAPVCLADGAAETQFTDTTVPASGGGFYYLLRGQVLCNDNPGFTTYSPKENPANPGKRDAELLACPP